MTAPKISIRDAIEAYEVAEHIGAEFRAARKRSGERQQDVAKRIGVRTSVVQRFEQGGEKNLKLGRASQLLRLYGLRLVVAKKPQADV